MRNPEFVRQMIKSIDQEQREGIGVYLKHGPFDGVIINFQPINFRKMIKLGGNFMMELSDDGEVAHYVIAWYDDRNGIAKFAGYCQTDDNCGDCP